MYPCVAGRAGTWLAEVVGADVTLRALIHKGALRLMERVTVAGQAITIVDDTWQPVAPEVRAGETTWFGNLLTAQQCMSFCY